MKSLPKKLKIFLYSIYLITILSLLILVSYNHVSLEITSINNIIFFTLLIAITETFSVVYKGLSFSTSFSIQLAAFILFGPIVTIIVTIIGFSLRVLKVNNTYKHIFNTPWYATLFNYCSLTIIILYASLVYKSLGGQASIKNMTIIIIPLILFCFTFFILNCLIMSILYSINSNKNMLFCFINNIKLAFLNIIIMAPFGIILALLFRNNSYVGVILFLFPILLARYTFSLYIEAKSKYVETVDVLMRAMEARDKYTEGHTKRVGELAKLIATELKYNQWKIDELYMAALLHDVGKIGIDDAILNKPGKLTEGEYNIIKTHPEIGFNIIKDLKDSEKINFIVRYHHERYDGKGYPEGKKPEELNLDVFIIQLADSIDAMATDRPYRKALAEDEIIKEVKANSGSQFHPQVVEAYLTLKKNKLKH